MIHSKVTVQFQKKIVLWFLFNLFFQTGIFLHFILHRVKVYFGDVVFDQILFFFKIPKMEIDSKMVTDFLEPGIKLYIFVIFCFMILAGSLVLCFGKNSSYVSRILLWIEQHLKIFLLSLFILSVTFSEIYFSYKSHFFWYFTIINLILFILCFGCFFNKGKRKIIYCLQFIRTHLQYTGILCVWLALGYFCWILFCGIIQLNILPVLLSFGKQSSLIDREYTETNLTDFQTGEKKNLLLIICESMESTFADPQVTAQNLIPELTELQTQGDTAKNLIGSAKCNYTISALYSYFYGMPILLYPGFGGNLRIGKNLFGKKSLSIFELLSYNGYSVTFLQGASLKFAQKNLLFEQIPDARVIGGDEISFLRCPKRGFAKGIFDSDLFEIAKEELLSVAGGQKPFAFALLTLDTHGGVEYDNKQDVIFQDQRDAIRKDSRLVSSFVHWVQQQPFASNTVIVIIGDHPIMKNSLGNLDLKKNQERRRIYNCILNSANGLKLKDKRSAQFDFAPTILDALGFSWSTYALGIGHSLYRDKPTIFEYYGVKIWERESSKVSKKYIELISE